MDLFKILDLEELDYLKEGGCTIGDEIILEGTHEGLEYWVMIAVTLTFSKNYNLDYGYTDYYDITTMVGVVDYGIDDLEYDFELSSQEVYELEEKLEDYIYGKNFG